MSESLLMISRESGSTAEPKQYIVFLSGAIRYLWKFHCGASPATVCNCLKPG